MIDFIIKTKIYKILKEIELVAAKPRAINNNITKLTGTVSSFRLRIGDIRVIYYLDEENNTIFVNKIAPRGSVYKY